MVDLNYVVIKEIGVLGVQSLAFGKWVCEIEWF